MTTNTNTETRTYYFTRPGGLGRIGFEAPNYIAAAGLFEAEFGEAGSLIDITVTNVWDEAAERNATNND